LDLGVLKETAMKTKILIPLLVVSAAIAAIGSGCLSMQSQSTLDAITSSGQSNAPVVEALIEYPGPAAKWAGPASFSLHVVAKDSGPANITVVPALFNNTAPPTTPEGRKIASEGAGKARTIASSKVNAMSGETARGYLQTLALSLQGAGETYRGCLYPIRVRLVRSDGSLVEKQGCRAASAWGRTASESVHYFISSALGF
jgi:hypothetical protein